MTDFRGGIYVFADIIFYKDAGGSDLGFKESCASEVKSVVRAFAQNLPG